MIRKESASQIFDLALLSRKTARQLCISTKQPGHTVAPAKTGLRASDRELNLSPKSPDQLSPIGVVFTSQKTSFSAPSGPIPTQIYD